MSNLGPLLDQFLGSDPTDGTKALQELLELGDSGEEALFSRPITYPGSVQLLRRWLRYVASRESTVVNRLVDRMLFQDRFNDAHAAAYLFAGLDNNRDALDVLFAKLESGFENKQPTIAMLRDYDDWRNVFEAWGYAGGDSMVLRQYVEASTFAWRKLLIFAFRGACAAFARLNSQDSYSVEQLLTHEMRDSGLVEIRNSPDYYSPNSITADEFEYQALLQFSKWRRGEVADLVIKNWSQHPHWRVRKFGAEIVMALGFQRTVTPIIQWLQRESVQSVRRSLLHALETSETPAGADGLIEDFNSGNQEGVAFLARSAWRANDKGRAVTALNAVLDQYREAEALVSLARMGHRHAQLAKMLASHDPYHRLNAALSLGYLGEKSALNPLLTMKREASNPTERIYLAAALAMLGRPEGARELNAEIVSAASAKGYHASKDIFFVHPYLKIAVLDALAVGGAQNYLDAWRAEFDPLNPVAQPVVTMSRMAPDGPSSKPETTLVKLSGAVTDPLKVFISYSHNDNRMFRKLIQHLTPLVDSGLIRIWHDREIEAGANWEGEIDREITEADIILLLVSPSFLSSRYCRKELMRALDLRSAGQSLPIPVILRPCDWPVIFNREEYKSQALPRDNRPVTDRHWTNQDAAFAAITRDLRVKIERMRR